ncbi:MAG: hypothetical protein AB1384_11145 [Actinomycetota bacterium]
MENWLESLRQAISGIMWSQWAALGAYVAAEPCRGSVIDPEALLVGTCAFGREDARIFDEAMDWTVINHGFLKPWRLRRISRAFGPDTQRTLGAFLDYVAGEVGKDILPGVRKEASDSLDGVGTEELFQHEKGRYDRQGKEPDEVFLKWKLLRGTPRIRNHSQKPDLGNPANLMLRLRDYYGAGARADVMTYLLTNRGGSSNGIALSTSYQQRRVYGVLEDLVGAGVAHKRGGHGNAYYWIDQERIAASLGLDKERPAFFVWGDIFFALDKVVSDRRRQQEVYANEFLTAERMRDLAVEVVPLLRKAGEPLSHIPFPNPGNLKGSQHEEAFIVFLDSVVDVLKSHMID